MEAFGAHRYLTTWQIGWLVEVIFVPANVFTGVQSFCYWSATTVTAISTQAWVGDFSGGVVVIFNQGTSGWVWCVRGPINADAY